MMTRMAGSVRTEGRESADKRVPATLATQTETGRIPWHSAVSARLLGEGVLIAGGYLLCFAVGIAFVLETGISVVWPPSGFALAILLRFGTRGIIPLWVGAALSNLIWTSMPTAGYVLMPSLTVAEPLLSIVLLRLIGFDSALRRLRDIAALATVGAPIGTLFNALASIYTLTILGETTWGDYWY